MSLVKQSLAVNYLKCALELCDSVKETENIDVNEYDYYNESISVISSLTDNRSIIKLFDYYFYQFSESKNPTKEVKMLYRSLKIDSYELLLIINSISSKCLRYSDFVTTLVPSEQLPFLSVLVGFYLFLIYMFDLCTLNRKMFSSDLMCSYKDFDKIISYSKRNIRGFNLNLKILLEELYPREPIPMGMKMVISTDLDLAFFQKFKLKHDFILIDYLLKSLLKDEYSYYSTRNKFSKHTFGSLIKEFRDNEYNEELSTEFYSLLKKRAYLIPNNGISLTPEDIVYSVDLYERQFNGDNYLILITNHEEDSYYSFINLTKNYTINNSPWLYDLCNFLYSFYKLKDVAEELYGKDFSEDPRLILSYKIDSFFKFRS